MFPERLRALRKGQKITLAELADALNQQFPTTKEHENTASQIGNWERGVRNPSYLEVQRLARFFNVSMDYITGLAENSQADLGRLFISDRELMFNGQQLTGQDRYEIYQLIEGYMHGKEQRHLPQDNELQLDLELTERNGED